ncbi:hypothetical protein DM860_001142 [Cuscuta australis]|uniref:Glycosyl hydrolases family 2 sugar binding domain-containing protein n=1 Tax=Cuscuta australis TaxID=267555 RepID=A0A328DT45_9ASTE|nr:hypothetical protein DM860_001142 [Cuscuta australis]
MVALFRTLNRTRFRCHGYDKPIYTNTKYPFHFDPSKVSNENPIGYYWTMFFLPKEWEATKTLSLRTFFLLLPSSSSFSFFFFFFLLRLSRPTSPPEAAAQPIVAAQPVAQARPSSPVAGSQPLPPSPPAAVAHGLRVQRRHAKRRTSPNAGRRCFAFAGSPSPPLPATTIIAAAAQRRRRRFTSSFCRTPPPLPASFPAVDCSAASRCSSPSSCRYATVAGVRHRRRIRPLPRVDIAGRLTSTPD